mgnify:CR=1 FL=1
MTQLAKSPVYRKNPMPLVRDMAQPVLHKAPLHLHKTLRVRALLQQTPAANKALRTIIGYRDASRPMQSGTTARDIQQPKPGRWSSPLMGEAIREQGTAHLAAAGNPTAMASPIEGDVSKPDTLAPG